MRRVALVYPASVPWIARCLDGIRRYAQEQGGWHLLCSPPTLRGAEESALTLRSLQGWKGDAIIAVSNDEEELAAGRKMKMPIINLAGGLSDSFGIPRVMVNQSQAGRMAAEHLLGRGLRHLAFFGWRDLWYSQQRHQGFSERAGEAGLTCHSFLEAAGETDPQIWPQRIAHVGAWLAALPKPVGIFAVHDYRAQFLMEACYDTGLRIPQEVAVIGMDNDETICEHSAPTLTSVSRSSEQVGWEAGTLLDRMMQGEPPPAADVLLEPDGVIERQSTDQLYSEEPLIQRALDYMRLHLQTQFNVEQIAEFIGVSKRTLETRFRENLQSSPYEFITRLRIQQAKALLHLPKKRTNEQIARECGFGTVRAFTGTFSRYTGQSPAAFRKTNARDVLPRRS